MRFTIFELNKRIMPRRFLPIIFLLFLIPNSWAQTPEIDSLKALMDNATTDTARIHYTIKYASELTYSNQKESRRLIDDCVLESKKLGYKLGEASALYAKAVSLALEGRYESSLQCMIESSNIYQQIGNKIGYAKCIGGQGNIYYFMDNFTKAKEYYENALEIYTKENHYIGMASCISNLGLISEALKDYKGSLKYQFEGLKIEEKQGNKRGIAISHIAISSLYNNLNYTHEAKKHAFLSLKYFKAIADTNGSSDALIRLAECYKTERNFDSVQYYLNETIRICKKINALSQLQSALELQTDIYDSLGYYYNAFQSQKQLIVVKDSLLNKEKTVQLVEMQTKFETDQKEKENEILIAKNFNQKLMLWGLLLVIASAFFITLQIFLSRRKLKLSHEKLITLHHEVQQQKEEIETQAENLIKANEAIIAQKDQIESTHLKISDSIVYASFIQSAMLPSDEILSNHFADNFILYKPRDVVSGDFYWFKEKNGNYILAVADCTGHGVPGALLSMMGISFLNDIVANSNEIKVSNILEELRQNVKLALGQFSNKSLRKEGIEIGLFSYNPDTSIISFSGAYLSLWLCRNGKMKEYKSDRMSIGISLKETPFTSTEFKVEKGDIVYMFTDGFADQLGGPYKKKLLRRNFLQEISEVSALPLSKQKNILEKIHHNWRGGNYDQIDDILVIGVKF